MKKILSSFVVVAFLLAGCAKNQVTGRSQLRLLPEKELQSMATQQYQQFLAQNKVVPVNVNKDAEMVRRVGTRIASAITQYLQKEGKGDLLEGYKWEFNLIDNKEVNAWCMPGGKIVVYTGLLPVTMNENALAVVMGHEVSHAIAKHGAERMSQGMIAQGLLAAGQVGLGVAMKDKPQATQSLWNNVFGVAAPMGAQVTLLANGRGQESEADHLGLIFMSMAGYDPRTATSFWQRMEASSTGARQPEFLSTHPNPASRIADLNADMPKALQYYKAAGGKL